METSNADKFVNDFYNDDYCHNCKFAVLVKDPEYFQRRYYCRNKFRIIDLINQIYSQYRNFYNYIGVNQDKDFPIDMFNKIHISCNKLETMMREWNSNTLRPTDSITCIYKAENE